MAQVADRLDISRHLVKQPARGSKARDPDSAPCRTLGAIRRTEQGKRRKRAMSDIDWAVFAAFWIAVAFVMVVFR